MADRNPVPLIEADVEDLHDDALENPNKAQIADIKHLHCRFYRECLNIALKGDWPQFSCRECKAGEAMEIFEGQMDVVHLNAVNRAAENEEKGGKVNRRRGVKPGADAKVHKRKDPGSAPPENCEMRLGDDGQVIYVPKATVEVEEAPEETEGGVMDEGAMEEDAPLVDAFPRF